MVDGESPVQLGHGASLQTCTLLFRDARDRIDRIYLFTPPKAAKWLRIVVNEAGEIITTYPLEK
jgi:hypothetical protein